MRTRLALTQASKLVLDLPTLEGWKAELACVGLSELMCLWWHCAGIHGASESLCASCCAYIWLLLFCYACVCTYYTYMCVIVVLLFLSYRRPWSRRGWLYVLRASGHASVCASVSPYIKDYRFPRYLQCLHYLLIDFRQTFVIGASGYKDELIRFWVHRSRSHYWGDERHNSSFHMSKFLVSIVAIMVVSYPQICCGLDIAVYGLEFRIELYNPQRPIPWRPQRDSQQWKREKTNGVLLRNRRIHDIVGQISPSYVFGRHGLWPSLSNPTLG